MDLPRGQGKVMEGIARLHRRLGRMPYVPELAEEMGHSHQSLRQHLAALERKHLLSVVSRGQGRMAEIIPTVHGKVFLSIGIPVLGYVAAGPMAPAVQQNLGLLALPSNPQTFALVVDGDSMADFFLAGDVVVVQRVSRPPKRKEICAVYDPEIGRATLKYVTVQGSKVLLEPHNPEYSKLTLPAKNLRLEGVYDYMLRGKSTEQLLRTLGVVM